MAPKKLISLKILGTEVEITETEHTIEICCPEEKKAAVQHYLEEEGILEEILSKESPP